MIVVRETAPNVFEPIYGNPVVLSSDGQRSAPLETIIAPSMTPVERAVFNIYIVDNAIIPAGHRIVNQSFVRSEAGIVEQRLETEPKPSVERDDFNGITPRDLVVALLTAMVQENVITQAKATAIATRARDALKRAL